MRAHFQQALIDGAEFADGELGIVEVGAFLRLDIPVTPDAVNGGGHVEVGHDHARVIKQRPLGRVEEAAVILRDAGLVRVTLVDDAREVAEPLPQSAAGVGPR